MRDRIIAVLDELGTDDQLQVAFEAVTAVRDSQSYAILGCADPDGINWSRVPQVPLPDKAPEHYRGHRVDGDIIAFLNRVYGPAGPDHPTRPNHPGWLDGKSMGREDLARLDPKGRKRLKTVEGKSGRIPDDILNLPDYVTIQDRRDEPAERERRATIRKARAYQRSMAKD